MYFLCFQSSPVSIEISFLAFIVRSFFIIMIFFLLFPFSLSFLLYTKKTNYYHACVRSLLRLIAPKNQTNLQKPTSKPNSPVIFFARILRFFLGRAPKTGKPQESLEKTSRMIKKTRLRNPFFLFFFLIILLLCYHNTFFPSRSQKKSPADSVLFVLW